jgi:hypothetical protein
VPFESSLCSAYMNRLRISRQLQSVTIAIQYN